MKSFFGVAAAVLLVVSMLFVAVPDAAQARGVGHDKMKAIKVKADNALIVVTQKKEKEANRQQWKRLHKHAADNALIAAYYLQVIEEGGEVFEDDANACDSVAGMVLQVVSLVSAGRFDMADNMIVRISVRVSSMPVGRAAAVVSIKVEVKKQSLDNRTVAILVVVSQRKKDSTVIVVTPGNGGGNNGGGNDNGGGNNQNERCVACQEVDKVKISTTPKCVEGQKVEEVETLFKCKKNYADSEYDENCTYKKRSTEKSGPCCLSDASCNDNDGCTADVCNAVEGTCSHSPYASCSNGGGLTVVITTK